MGGSVAGNREVSYIVFQDVARDEGLVDARVLVGSKMYKSLRRETIMSSIALDQNQLVVEDTNGGRCSKEDQALCHRICLLTFSTHLTSLEDAGFAADTISMKWHTQ